MKGFRDFGLGLLTLVAALCAALLLCVFFAVILT